MMSSIRFVIILFPLAVLSKPACEDDTSFSDSFGWTCRDYGRVPDQCKFSKEWEKDGKTALLSCCVCRKSMKNKIISDNLHKLFTDHVSTRRQSEDCLNSCSLESETCSGSCEEDKNNCASTCEEVEMTCSWLCEQFGEEEEDDEEGGGVVEDDDTNTLNSSSFSRQIVWYIIIGVLSLLACLCCCFVVYYLMGIRVKTADAGPPQQITREQVPMVPSTRYTQEVQDQYSAQQYLNQVNYPTVPY